MRQPSAGSINLPTIAHHLSLINRFTGATCRPYSVAEHSLLVCDIAVREFGADVHGQFAALMHDAHEAYVGDTSTPVKRELGQSWAEFEYRFERLIRSCFGLHVASSAWQRQIKQADLIALATERAQLLPAGGTPWEALVHIQPVTWVDLMSTERCGTSWTCWRQSFTDRANQLDFERQQRVLQLGR